MRVCLDCTPLLVRSAGVKTYTFELHSHLRRLAPKGDLISFPFLNGVNDLDHDASVLSRPSTLARLALIYFLNTGSNPALDWFSRRLDLFHASNQIRNPPRHAKLTTVVQDLTCWRRPDLHTPANIANDYAFARNIVMRAHGIIVPSENTRNDLVELLGVDDDKVQTIHHGISEAYFHAPKLSPALTAHYRLKGPYLLFVSTIEPRKNVDRLLDAYEALSAEIRNEFDLIVAGPAGWSSDRSMQRLQSGIPGVRYLGYVPERHLPSLTAGASLFVYPSLYEGFGFPVAQAMAAGVPVLTSNNSSLPEVAGDAARLIDPLSVEEMRAAMTELLLSPSSRAILSARGSERARSFQWRECAERTWRFFQKVYDEQ